MPRFVSAHLTSYCSKKIYTQHTPVPMSYTVMAFEYQYLLHDILNCGHFFKCDVEGNK